VISIYYHPTEFVHTEFWDAVNFAKGANPPRSAWILPQRRTQQDSERCFHVLHAFVEHMKRNPGVQFVTAKDLPQLFEAPSAGPVPEQRYVAEHLLSEIIFLDTEKYTLSAADMLMQLLGIARQSVDGPISEGLTTWTAESISAEAFDRAKQDAVDFIRQNGRLPAEIFAGSQTLSLNDFTATLAGALLNPGGSLVRVMHGRTGFDKYFSRDPRKSFNWIIHPEGFSAPELLEMGRLQGWTLKPARLRAR
jgi:hypothetical protein